MSVLNAGGQPFGAGVDSLVQKNYRTATAPGVAVLLRMGDSVYTAAAGYADLEKKTPIQSNTQFRLASVGKQFTAKTIYQLVLKGQLSYDTKLEHVLEAVPQAAREITIGDLLNHGSGIGDYEELIPSGHQKQLSDDDVWDLVRRKDSVYFETGTAFRYSNTGYCLLALITEKVSGMKYAAYVREHIFKPIQLVDATVFDAAAFIPHRAYGYHPRNGTFIFADQSITSATKGDGGIYMSVKEYDRWVNESFNVLPGHENYLKAIFANARPVTGNTTYSLGWFLAEEADGTVGFFHSGESTGFHNIVYINPSKKIHIVIFSNRDDLKIAILFAELAAFARIVPRATGQEEGSLFGWLSNVYSHTQNVP